MARQDFVRVDMDGRGLNFLKFSPGEAQKYIDSHPGSSTKKVPPLGTMPENGGVEKRGGNSGSSDSGLIKELRAEIADLRKRVEASEHSREAKEPKEPAAKAS